MKNIADLIPLLLELPRGRAGKWDAVKDAIRSKDRVVGLVTVILAFVPAIILALAVVFVAAR